MIIPRILWWNGRFEDPNVESAYLTFAWPSVRTQISLTLIGFSLAWVVSAVTDLPYLSRIDWFFLIPGLRLLTGVFGIAAGAYLLATGASNSDRAPKILLWSWMALSTATAVAVSNTHVAVQTNVVDTIDLLDFNSFWMSLQVLGLGIALSATYTGVVLMAGAYATSYVWAVTYWRDYIEVSLIGPAILVLAVCVFAVIMTVTFSASGRRRYYTTWKYEEARKEAEKAQEFSAFLLSTAGHDIRQPIYSLDLNAATMEELADAGDWERVRSMISRQRLVLRSVSGLLSSILELSHQEPSDTSEGKCTSLAEVFGNLQASFHTLARHHEVNLRVVPSTLKIASDPGILAHILNNLVANALSHSGGSRVLVGARRCGDQVVISVSDNGQGLGGARHSKRATGLEAQASGFGLGSSIIERLAELDGLTLEMRSNPGQGVTAQVVCPRV